MTKKELLDLLDFEILEKEKEQRVNTRMRLFSGGMWASLLIYLNAQLVPLLSAPNGVNWVLFSLVVIFFIFSLLLFLIFFYSVPMRKTDSFLRKYIPFKMTITTTLRSFSATLILGGIFSFFVYKAFVTAYQLNLSWVVWVTLICNTLPILLALYREIRGHLSKAGHPPNLNNFIDNSLDGLLLEIGMIVIACLFFLNFSSFIETFKIVRSLVAQNEIFLIVFACTAFILAFLMLLQSFNHHYHVESLKNLKRALLKKDIKVQEAGEAYNQLLFGVSLEEYIQERKKEISKIVTECHETLVQKELSSKQIKSLKKELKTVIAKYSALLELLDRLLVIGHPDSQLKAKSLINDFRKDLEHRFINLEAEMDKHA